MIVIVVVVCLLVMYMYLLDGDGVINDRCGKERVSRSRLEGGLCSLLLSC